LDYRSKHVEFILAAIVARSSMSNAPTRTAVAGRFQSKTGEDLIQFVDSDGNVVVWIDCNGVLYINSSAVIHGADGATGVSIGPGQPGTPS
jgi:hypothetical protein